MLSIDGLISGLNTESIINGLVSLQQQQVERLNVRKTSIRSQQQALQGIEARLLGLRAQMGALNRNNNSLFSARTAQSSHEQILTATVGPTAVETSYSLRVTSRATAHQLGSNGFSSSSQEITTGTISFQVGDRPPVEIVVDESNRTVAGLVQAINAQATDLSAAIVRDQGSGTDRILLTSKHTGAANQIAIVNQLGPSAGGAVQPDFSGPAVQDAANAAVQLGSGPGAITAEFATNRIDGLIQGVTLDIHSVDANQDVLLTISRDTSQAEQAIKDFVEEFNDLMSFLDEQTRFDPATQTASPLLGNRTVSAIKNQLLSLVSNVTPGLSASLNRLSQIGITISGNGRLNLDSSRLSAVLQGTVDGVDPSQISRLFGMTASSSVSGLEFIMGSTRTKDSSTPYQVDITQAAERAVLTASQALAEQIVIDSANRQLKLSIDGLTSETLTLAEGTYTRSELAAHLESVINASNHLGNRDVLVTLDGERLQITSLAYGSQSKVSDLSGSALTALGLDGSETAVGKDVAGSFIVNGVVEPATGNGRLLIGNIDNAHTADLQIRVLLTPAQVHDGVEGELTLTRGVTSRLDQYLGDALDSQRGTLMSVQDRFDAQIESIDKSIARVNAISEAKREYLIRQFSALERSLNALQTTSAIVSSQLLTLTR